MGCCSNRGLDSFVTHQALLFAHYAGARDLEFQNHDKLTRCISCNARCPARAGISRYSDPVFWSAIPQTLKVCLPCSVVDALMERLLEIAPRSSAVSLVQLLRHTCRDVEGREAQGTRLKVRTNCLYTAHTVRAWFSVWTQIRCSF